MWGLVSIPPWGRIIVCGLEPPRLPVRILTSLSMNWMSYPRVRLSTGQNHLKHEIEKLPDAAHEREQTLI